MKKLGEKRIEKKQAEIAAFAAMPSELQEASWSLERVKAAKTSRGCLVALTIMAGLGVAACGTACIVQAVRSNGEGGTGGTGGVSDEDVAAFGSTGGGAYC